MAKILIESDNPNLNGSFEFDPSYFTNRELHTLKQEAKVRAGEIMDAFAAGDTDLLVVFAHIALRRAGRDIPIDALWDLEAGKITFDVGEEAADVRPPENASDASDSSGAIEASSLPSSANGEAFPEPIPLSTIGNPG